jgi:hypothetical protein
VTAGAESSRTVTVSGSTPVGPVVPDGFEDVSVEPPLPLESLGPVGPEGPVVPELVVLGFEPELVVEELELESGLPDAEPDPLGCEVRTVGSVWVWLRPGSAGLAVAAVVVADLSVAGLVAVVAVAAFVVLSGFTWVFAAASFAAAFALASCLAAFFERSVVAVA